MKMLKRDEINLKLHAAGFPPHIICRKRIPERFGLIGATESNVIFDESQEVPIALAVLGWQYEADENLKNFIEENNQKYGK